MHLSLDQWNTAIGAASLLVAVLVVVVPPVRRRVVALGWRLVRLSGSDSRRYRRWFAEVHGTVHNVYLDRREDLTLRDTYVPLAGYRGAEVERVAAADVLVDPANARLVILGDPGTGKSTLLRAFGTSLAAPGRAKEGHVALRGTPVFVALRLLARWLSGAGGGAARGLDGFLEHEVLPAAKVRQPASFLAALRSGGELVLLLDGLDEVPDESRAAVRSAVLAFVGRHDVRVVLTCRRQNFHALRTDWIPALAEQTYTLARLKDDEIRTFIGRRAREFAAHRTPGDLFASIVDSGTLELHRIPLILTVSISLYTRLAGYRIPTSLAAFYDEMIKQLVTRHDFRLEVTGSVNRFSGEDKLRFLRELAHRAATRNGRFEDVSLAELVALADELTDRLPTVARGEAEAFVAEIVNRSGLLVQASMESDHVFAHRSIQEFLIARRLLGAPEAGARQLLERAGDAEWRLVTIFFCAFEHDHVAAFLRDLARRSPELCGQCLAVATIADRHVVGEVMTGLRGRVTRSVGADAEAAFAALVRLASAALPWVRDDAVAALLDCLTRPGLDLAEFVALDQDSVARLIAGLADEPAALPVVARLVELPAADSVANIGPLWRTYGLTLNEPLPYPAVVGRALLRLCRTPAGLAELQAQPPLRDQASDQQVRDAYPFREGLPPRSNLPVLVATVRADLWVVGVNAFLDAVAAKDPDLATLERDRRRRVTSVRLFRPARILTAAAYVGAAVAIVLGVVQRGLPAYLIAPGPVGLNLLYAVPPVLAALVALGLAARDGTMLKLPASGFLIDPHRLERGSGSRPDPITRSPVRANPMVYVLDRTAGLDGFGRPYWDHDTAFLLVNAWLFTLPLAVALRVVLPPDRLGLVPYLTLATLVVWLVFWLPATYLCCRDVVLHLRRRNPLLALYDDPACGHWLVPPAEAGRVRT